MTPLLIATGIIFLLCFKSWRDCRRIINRRDSGPLASSGERGANPHLAQKSRSYLGRVGGRSAKNGSRSPGDVRYFLVTEKELRRREEAEAHMSIWPTTKRRVRRVS